MNDYDGTNPGTALNLWRWSKIPREQRADYVPRNGGRPRIYPPCVKKYPHVWVEHICRYCGYKRDPSETEKRVGLTNIKTSGKQGKLLMKVRE